MSDCQHPEKVEFRMREYGESITGLGVVWIVEEFHGSCGCGQTELTSVAGYFPSRFHAKAFILFMTEHRNAVIEFALSFNALVNRTKKPPVQ